MVNYSLTDVIPLKDFEFAWRITDPKWAVLPEEALKRIRPLSQARGKQLFEASLIFAREQLPCDPGRYHPIAQTSLEECETADGERIRSWFRGLPIPLKEEVYLCWAIGEGVAAVSDWTNVIDNWNDLWYPFDSLCVYDESMDWAVVFGVEEEAYFIRRGPTESKVVSPVSTAESMVAKSPYAERIGGI